MRYILTMPLDRQPSGTDVTGRYRAVVLARLIDEGYVEVVEEGGDSEEPEVYWPDLDEEGEDADGD